MTSSTMLNGLRAIGFRRNYISGRHNLAQELFIPALTNAVRYDRAVGFFSSGWIRANAQGLAQFALNGGQARWVTSPILSKEDASALLKVQDLQQNESIIQSLLSSIGSLHTALEKDTLNTMAWMIFDGMLQFKFAIPIEDLDGDFHDKFGIFYDQYNQKVSFLGSYNDTSKGLRNYESLRVFFSWEEAGVEIVEDDIQRFERIWNGHELNLRIFDLPKAVKHRILQLRVDERPYKPPLSTENSYSGITLAEVFPREYQLEAITKWVANGKRGILDMATGTGKTVTALTAITKCSGVNYIVVAAPTQGLVTQWMKELQQLEGLRLPFIEISANNPGWRDEVFSRFEILAAGLADTRPFVFIGTYQSLASADFRNRLTKLDSEKILGLLVADEVHHIGATSAQHLMQETIQFRLGLTATLDRAFDEEGTQAIENYFGGVVYTLSLADAVGPILCPYQYKVIFAELTQEEFKQYQNLSAKIARVSTKPGELQGKKTLAEHLLIQRARITKLAQNKIEVLKDYIEHSNLHRCLIYCADLEQVAAVQQLLGEANIANLPYTSEQTNEERTIALGQLARNEISAVVAIDCLDEGVDVPQVHQAILLASSSSERQFVQRRGRILRKAPGKKKAELIDVLTVPPLGIHERPPTLLYNEMRRALLLAQVAENRYQVEQLLVEEFEQFGVPIEDVVSSDEYFAPS